MATMYVTVHKDENSLIGEQYCNDTWHMVCDQFYELDNARQCVADHKHKIIYRTEVQDGKRYFAEIIH